MYLPKIDRKELNIFLDQFPPITKALFSGVRFWMGDHLTKSLVLSVLFFWPLIIIINNNTLHHHYFTIQMNFTAQRTKKNKKKKAIIENEFLSISYSHIHVRIDHGSLPLWSKKLSYVRRGQNLDRWLPGICWRFLSVVFFSFFFHC